jgi:predicted transcriptional regulator
MKAKPKVEPETRVTSIRIRPDLLERAKIHAVRTRASLQSLIGRALEDLLKREENKR